MIVDPIRDRHGRSILTVRDQNTFAEKLRQKRLMDVIHLWLIHRFKPEIVYYVTPTEDNIYQTEKMKSHGIFSDVYQEVGEIIVADVNQERIEELLAPDRAALGRLIRKEELADQFGWNVAAIRRIPSRQSRVRAADQFTHRAARRSDCPAAPARSPRRPAPCRPVSRDSHTTPGG